MGDYAERSVAGERVVITGATNGIGKELARELARRGANLTLVARNELKATDTAKELSAERGSSGVPDIVVADLASLASVRRGAEEILDRYEHIGTLVNNAGIHVLSPETTVDGFESMTATNHLGPFLLTSLLLDRLRDSAPARIVNTASEAHRNSFGGPDLEKLAAPASFTPIGAERYYARSKLMNVLFTAELARRLGDSGVTVNCFCPGLVDTGLMRGSSLVLAGSRALGRIGVIRNPAQGARMGVRLVLDEELAGATGGFYTSTPGLRFLPATPVRSDADYQRRLFDRSAELVGL